MRRVWQRRLVQASLPVVLGLALVACGSSSKSSSPTSPTTQAAASGSSGTTPSTAATGGTASQLGSPYVIGFECSCSGAFASSTSGQATLINTWAKYENANGGVDGHAVQIILMDDALNPGTSLAQVTKMVTQDHVLAIMDGSDVDSSWGTFVQKAGVPVIGDNLSSTLMFTNADFFPQGQTINTLAPSIAGAAQRAGVKKLGMVYCSSDPVCAELAKPIQQAASANGVKAGFAGAISETAPNYTAPCLAAKQSGADGIFVAESSTVALSFESSCQAQGYHPIYIAEDGAVAASWLSAAGFQGSVNVENNLPATDTSNSAVAAMTSALNKYAPGTTTSSTYGPSSTGIWAAGMLFADAAKAGNLGNNPTSAELLNGLYALNGDTLDGLAPPLTFHRGQPTSVGCWFYLGISNHQWTTPYGGNSYCAPPSSS